MQSYAAEEFSSGEFIVKRAKGLCPHPGGLGPPACPGPSFPQDRHRARRVRIAARIGGTTNTEEAALMTALN